MKTHLARGSLIALIAAVIVIGPAVLRADDNGHGKTVINTPLAPPAIGPYSQAIRVGSTVYVSGEVGADATGTIVGPSIEQGAGTAGRIRHPVREVPPAERGLVRGIDGRAAQPCRAVGEFL